MKSRKPLIGCGIALVLGAGVVLIGVIAGYLGFIPGMDQQLPLDTTSILVNINLPLNGAELPLNEPVSIYAEAVSGQPIHDLELWLDGAFSPTKMDTSPADQSLLSTVWLWTPAEEGVHRLIVRAIGPDGEVVNSNVVRVSVLPREKIADLHIPIPPEQLPPLGSSAADAAFQFPEGSTEMPEPPPFPIEDQPQVPASPAGAPGLQGSINLCDAALVIQDNAGDEKGFYIYRLDPTSADFARVATLDKYPDTGSFTYIDPGLSQGNHTYYIASFNGTGETPSNLINLKVTEAQCTGNGPQAFGLQDAMLTTTKAVDKIYCYLSVDQGPWKRIPYGSNTFIYASAGGFDLGKYLNNLTSSPLPPGGVTLELECWGWSGGTLVYLGYLKQVVDKGPAQFIGTDFMLIGQVLDNITVPETTPSKLSPNIAPPYWLDLFREHDKCVAHLTGKHTPETVANECGGLPDGYTYLFWRWIPSCWIPHPSCKFNVKDIDGYRVYRVNPGMDPVLVHDIHHPDRTLDTIPPTGAGLLVQPEYFVRAYKGDQESMDSQHVMGLPPKYTKTFTPIKLFVSWAEKIDDDLTNDWASVYTGEALVGYDNHFSTGGAWSPIGGSGDSYYSFYSDVRISFDVPQKTSVTSAILRWKVKSVVYQGGGLAAGLPNGCWIPLADGYGATIADYPLWHNEDGYNVTTQVRAWTQPGINKRGFWLFSGSHTLEQESNDVCLLKVGDFELEVSSDKPIE